MSRGPLAIADGVEIGQGKAIARFVAKSYGLMGGIYCSRFSFRNKTDGPAGAPLLNTSNGKGRNIKMSPLCLFRVIAT